MIKKFVFILVLVLVSVTGCDEKKYERYQTDFTGVFDTYTMIIGYSESQQQFEAHAQIIYDKLLELHQLFDIYNDYEGVVNVKTINDHAGRTPVKVDPTLLDILLLSKQAYMETNGAVNAALGSVLSIWHNYRTVGLENPDNAKLPPMDLLKEAAKNTDIEDIIIDREAGTVFLKNPDMSLDVGAIAKGYAVQLAMEAAKDAGMTSALINAGGNVAATGKPMDGTRDRWGIGIQDPEKSAGNVNNVLDTIYVNDAVVVSSGDYQRYYYVDGKAYHHIIDPATLMPADRYAEVSVVCEDSGMGDILSTALYILPMDEGRALAEQWGAEVLWVKHDGSLEATNGYRDISKELGGYSAVDKK